MPSTAPADVDLATIDGEHLRLRPIRAEDGDALVAFHSTLSDETIYMRYFSSHPQLSVKEVERFTRVDGSRRAALVALDHDRIVGVGRYDRIGETSEAEVAFVVADAYQGRGIATALLRGLAALAITHDIETFVADTLFRNTKMRSVFKDAGYVLTSDVDSGVVHVAFAIGGQRARPVRRRPGNRPNSGIAVHNEEESCAPSGRADAA